MQYLANNKRLDKQYKQRKKCYTWQNLYIHKLNIVFAQIIKYNNRGYPLFLGYNGKNYED